MNTDYAKLEREFLDGLEAKTGRDLKNWMTAIDAEALPDRNAVIDWLRANGFLFSRASWLQRIHQNGGRPLYAGRPPAAAKAERSRRASPSVKASRQNREPESATVLPFTAPSKARQPSAQPPARKDEPRPPSRPANAAIDVVIAKAKGYGPLARFVLAEIEKAVPGTVLSAGDGFITAGAPEVFAVLAPSPKSLKLGLALGDGSYERFDKTRPGASALPIPPSVTHMTVLTDARSINDELIGLVRLAARKSSG